MKNIHKRRATWRRLGFPSFTFFSIIIRFLSLAILILVEISSTSYNYKNHYYNFSIQKKLTLNSPKKECKAKHLIATKEGEYLSSCCRAEWSGGRGGAATHGCDADRRLWRSCLKDININNLSFLCS